MRWHSEKNKRKKQKAGRKEERKKKQAMICHLGDLTSLTKHNLVLIYPAFLLCDLHVQEGLDSFARQVPLGISNFVPEFLLLVLFF